MSSVSMLEENIEMSPLNRDRRLRYYENPDVGEEIGRLFRCACVCFCSIFILIIIIIISTILAIIYS